MFSNFTIYLQRIGVAFGLSLALVGAVAAQTADFGGADLTDEPQIADPTKSGYGFRHGLYNLGTTIGGIFQGQDWREDRHLALNQDYVRQCNKAKDKQDVLARVLARKEQHDAFLGQIAAADPTFKDEVARQFAAQRGAFLSIKNATSGAAFTGIDRALDRVAVAEANFTGKKGLPPDAEAQLKAMGIPDDKIAKIKAAADQNWSAGYQAFKQLMSENPDLARVMESGFHRADFEFHGAREFGGLPPGALEHFRNAEQIAGVQFLSNPEFVGKYKDFAGSAIKNLNFDFDDPSKQAEFKKFLPADQLKRIQDFQSQLKAEFGDPSKIDPSRFHEFTKGFETKFGPPPEGFHGGGEFHGGPYPEPKAGQYGTYSPGSYQGGTYSPGTYTPPPGGTTATHQYQSGDQHTGSYTTSPSPTYTSSPTYTASPTPTSTYTSPTPTSTSTYSSPTPTTTSTTTPTCSTGYHYVSGTGCVADTHN